MDRDAFEKLLELFDPDRDRAGELYEKLRSRLIAFFRWNGCRESDFLADKAFDVVMSHLNEGQAVRAPVAYILGVARRVALGAYKKDGRTAYIQDTPRTVWDCSPEELPIEEYASPEYARCLESCIGKLPVSDQRLIREYYLYDKREKIDCRVSLAAELNTTLSTLRIKAFRIRKRLRACIVACVRDSRDATKR